MHYRIRGNSVQIVKTVPDPTSGKARSEPVGSANIRTGEITERASRNLSPEERTEIEAWLKRKQELDAKKRELDVQMLPSTISNAIAWIKSAEPAQVAALSDELLFSASDLNRAIETKLKDTGATRQA